MKVEGWKLDDGLGRIKKKETRIKSKDEGGRMEVKVLDDG